MAPEPARVKVRRWLALWPMCLESWSDNIGGPATVVNYPLRRTIVGKRFASPIANRLPGD